jgi:transcription elongation factor Elf1
MNGLQKLKKHLKILQQLAKANNCGFYCPSCSIKSSTATARVRTVKDELCHKTKYFIRCKRCKLTTPAYETIKEAVDAWEDTCISVKDRMLISIYANKEDND